VTGKWLELRGANRGRHFQRRPDRGVSDPVIPALHLYARQSRMDSESVSRYIGRMYACM